MTTLIDQIEENGFNYELVSEDPPRVRWPGLSAIIALSDEQWKDLKCREESAHRQLYPRG